MSNAVNEAITLIAKQLDEEAAAYTMAVLAGPKVTQDNYGRVLGFLAGLPQVPNVPHVVLQAGFLQAMVNNGYPRATAASIRQISGLPGESDSQAILMGLA